MMFISMLDLLRRLSYILILLVILSSNVVLCLLFGLNSTGHDVHVTTYNNNSSSKKIQHKLVHGYCLDKNMCK